MRFAQILNGRAHWVFESDEKPEFAPNLVLVEVGPEVQEGWPWDGENFSPPKEESEPAEPTLEEVKAEKLAELAEARWREETGGLTLPDGTVIKTDRESQALLTGASLYALQNAKATVEWKGANGWVTLTASDIQKIAYLVRNHVQAAFSKERDYAEKVNGCSTVAEVQAVSWGE